MANKKSGLLHRIIIRLIINAAAIYLAAQVISGIHLSGWKAILLVAVIFGIINSLIKPFVFLATCLLQLLTLGLFTLIINAAMLYLTEWFAEQLELDFTIDDFLSALLGAILISIVSFILSKFLK